MFQQNTPQKIEMDENDGAHKMKREREGQRYREKKLINSWFGRTTRASFK